jgi:hypothetical protein
VKKRYRVIPKTYELPGAHDFWCEFTDDVCTSQGPRRPEQSTRSDGTWGLIGWSKERAFEHWRYCKAEFKEVPALEPTEVTS